MSNILYVRMYVYTYVYKHAVLIRIEATTLATTGTKRINIKIVNKRNPNSTHVKWVT